MLIDHLNLVFGDSQESTTYWNTELKKLIMARFESALSPEEMSEQYCLKNAISQSFEGLIDGKCLLFKKLSAEVGLQWQPATHHAFSENPKVYNFAHPLDEADLELQAVVKTMNIGTVFWWIFLTLLAQHSEGFVLKLKASKRTGEESIRLYKLAILKFTDALERTPGNKVTARNLADCLVSIGEFDQAEYYYQEAIKAGPKDTNTLFKYACFLERYGKYDLAEEYYLRALEAFSFHSSALTVYADFLASCRKDFSQAEHFYKCALSADPRNVFCLNNFACFLTFVKKDYNLAEEYFKKCIEVDPHQPLRIFKIGIFRVKTTV
jgi:tetratricopeptide (TPR) repeat protein